MTAQWPPNGWGWWLAGTRFACLRWIGNRILVAATGDDRPGWEEEARRHEQFLADDDRWSGSVVCSECGTGAFMSGRRSDRPRVAYWVCPRCQP